MRFSVVSTISLLMFLIGCQPPPSPPGEDAVSSYWVVSEMRAAQFRSAAYLIDLRVDDDGKKFSVGTELYFSGDSVGFYGRGFLGKGAFKGNIIDDIVTVYFNRQNEYYSEQLADISPDDDCAQPAEVMLLMLSRLAGGKALPKGNEVVFTSTNTIEYSEGRFLRTIKSDHRGFPEEEKLIDALCQDSIEIGYMSQSRQFPFYKVRDLLYYNALHNFRARGFIREQKYNIEIDSKKFTVDIPASANRIDSF